MADSLKVELITRDFGRMLEELANIDPTIEFKQVVLSEASAVARGAMGRTRAASVSKIRGKHNDAKYTTFGGKVYCLTNKYPDYVWSGLQRFRRERLTTKLGARGLAKQSWYNLGQKLNRPFAAPGYVVSANYKSRQYTEDVSVEEAGTGRGYTVTLINNSPLGEGAAMTNALIYAMGGRAGYFRQNMAHHAFATMASRAAKYPGIFPSPVPPPAPS